MNKIKMKKKKESGQSMVELAISLTILLGLLAGVVDLGRAYFTFISLRDAAQEGASYGSVYPTFCDQIRGRVRDTSNSPVDLSELGTDDIQIIINGMNCEQAVVKKSACAPNEIRVEVVYDDFSLSMPLLGTMLGTQTVTLQSSVADTIITNPCTIY